MALDDISVSLGDCELVAGNSYKKAQREKEMFLFYNPAFKEKNPTSLKTRSWNPASSLILHIDFPLVGLLSSLLPGRCDFEAGLCGYTQDKKSDAADWERRRGATPTSYTGPRGDHTAGLGESPLLLYKLILSVIISP